jgi:hypothetical protein
MTYYVDNTPDYYTSRPPALQEVQYEIVASGPVEDVGGDDDYCEPTRQVLFIKPTKLVGEEGGLTAKDAVRLLERGLTPPRCHCEHDCCGHRFGFAHAEWLALDCIRITVNTLRNF